MSEIAKLSVVPIDRTGRPQQDVIDFLGGIFARAMTGEIQAVAVAVACADGHPLHGHSWGGDTEMYQIATGLTLLQHDLVCDLEQGTQSVRIIDPPDPAA